MAGMLTVGTDRKASTIEARECGWALTPDYGGFILPPAAMRRTHQQFTDYGGFPHFQIEKVWVVRTG